ncbi:hypothetical protein GF382_00940 [Candidatus Falkowbacteria bacterium]|nr:hypothetical protein [Candidatus Falkowbacteria bacterium]
MPESEYFRKAKSKNKRSINFKLVNIVLSILILFSVAYYVVGINELVVKGFKIQELRNQAVSLENENKNFDIYATSLKSYNNLAKRVESLGMIETDKVDYIRKTSAVAVR